MSHAGSRNVARAARGACLAVLCLSCGRDLPTTSNDPAPPPAEVRLVSPAQNASVPQNNPDIGCPFHQTAGYGVSITFEWSDAGPSGGTYELFVKHPTATIPLVNARVSATRHVERSCNSFVADRNLNGWEWKVTAVDPSGRRRESATGVFHFAPCRIGGVPCTAS